MGEDKIEVAKLQTDVDWIKKELSNLQKEVKNGFDRLYGELKKVNESYTALRNDVNIANTRTIENKEKIRKVSKRVSTIELYISNQKTLTKFILGTIGMIGSGNILWLIINFIEWVAKK